MSDNHSSSGLLDSFGGFELTSGQVEALRKLESFIHGEKPNLFLLKGYAGTGKTFLIKGLAHYLRRIGREYELMAPTGRASRVIKEKTGDRASTIHKTIYNFDEIKEYKYIEEDGSESYRLFFAIKQGVDSSKAIYIVDESSMISDKYSDDEFIRFGSGYLLQDLFNFVDPGGWRNRKIIFIGDTAQLPPYNMNISPALDKEYLWENYGLESDEFEMTQVLRQQEDSGIMINAINLRNAIKSGIYNKFEINTKYAEVININTDNLISEYRKRMVKEEISNSIIVAHSNSTVRDYNDILRDFLFPGRATINAGDRLLVVKNNYYHLVELFNGDLGLVTSASPGLETRKVPIGKGRAKTVTLHFRDIQAEFTDSGGQVHELTCKLLENLLVSRERDLSPEEKRALYIDFKIRHSGLKPGTASFRRALFDDPYFNCLFAKYGYAVTCHKAQGGEWKNAFVDFRTGMGYCSEAYFRWAYTAMTRAQSCLIAMNLPFTGPYQSLAPFSGQQALPDQVTQTLVLPARVQDVQDCFAFPPDSGFLQRICRAVCYLLQGTGYTVERVDHLQYCERYCLAGPGDGNYQFDLYYNRRQMVTRIGFSPRVEQGFKQKMDDLLQVLVGREICIDGQAPEPERNKEVKTPVFPAEQPFLEEFYHVIQQNLAERHIGIEDVAHYPYLEKYTFLRNQERAVIDVYYNKKGVFTRYMPQYKQSNSDRLIQEIDEVFKKLVKKS